MITDLPLLAWHVGPLAAGMPLSDTGSETVPMFYIFVSAQAEHEGVISHAFTGQVCSTWA